MCNNDFHGPRIRMSTVKVPDGVNSKNTVRHMVYALIHVSATDATEKGETPQSGHRATLGPNNGVVDS